MPCVVPITKSSSSLIFSLAVSIMIINPIQCIFYLTHAAFITRSSVWVFFMSLVSLPNIFYLWSIVRITVLMSLLANSNSVSVLGWFQLIDMSPHYGLYFHVCLHAW